MLTTPTDDTGGTHRLLRRRAAPALLIQDLEFQTIKCVSIRSSGKKCTSGKNGQNAQNICVGHAVMLFALFEQSIFKVPKKTEETPKRNDLAGPKKVDFFQFLDHSNSTS